MTYSNVCVFLYYLLFVNLKPLNMVFLNIYICVYMYIFTCTYMYVHGSLPNRQGSHWLWDYQVSCEGLDGFRPASVAALGLSDKLHKAGCKALRVDWGRDAKEGVVREHLGVSRPQGIVGGGGRVLADLIIKLKSKSQSTSKSKKERKTSNLKHRC